MARHSVARHPLPAAPLPAALLAAAPLPTAEPAGAPPAPSAEGRGAADAAAFAAFAAGAGLAGHPAGDPNEALRELGAAFRAVVSGLRRMMIARATIKGEFRIGQTMIQPIGNNPLKFAADDDDALAALLGIGRQGGMSPARAVSDALQDMRLHELAVAAAMQTAVREVMGELDPARIMREQPPRAFEAVFGRRRRGAWQVYEGRHAAMMRAFADDFDSAFGKAFVRAYEAALADLDARQTRAGS